MIARIWSGESPLWRLLLPFSWLYGLVSGAIRLSYKLGFKRAWRAPVPVVVVGNLTAGGNGKTPVVIWLVEQLQRRGVRVGVVSRGYGGKAAAYPLFLTPETTTAEAGDEPVLIYQRTGAPVAVAPERAAAVKAILAAHNVQIIITDDGLQHYRLARDIEIVVIDGVRRFGNGWWLPAGPMRERASRLKTVDAAIVNGARPGGRNTYAASAWTGGELTYGSALRRGATEQYCGDGGHWPSAALFRDAGILWRASAKVRPAGGSSNARPC